MPGLRALERREQGGEPAGGPGLLGTERLGASLSWGLEGGRGARKPTLPSSGWLWASHFPVGTSATSPVKWGGSILSFLPAVFMSACEMPGTVQGPQGFCPLAIYILMEETDHQQADKSINENNLRYQWALWSSRIGWCDGDWGGGCFKQGDQGTPHEEEEVTFKLRPGSKGASPEVEVEGVRRGRRECSRRGHGWCQGQEPGWGLRHKAGQCG